MYPVYALLGPESGEKSVALSKIKKDIEKEYGGEVEVSRFYPFETENGEAVRDLSNVSLFSDFRMVVVSQVEDLKATALKELARYIRDPSDSAVLVLISAETRLPSELDSAIKAAKYGTKDEPAVRIFYEMFDSRKVPWLMDRFRDEGYRADPEACRLILDMVENDTRELRITASQLMSYLGDRRYVTVDDVEEFLSHTKAEDGASLFRHIANGKLSAAVAAANSIIINDGPQGLPGLFSRLSTQMEHSVSYKEKLDAGASEEAALMVPSPFGDGKEYRITNIKEKDSLRAMARNYSLQEQRRILSLIPEYDLKIRTAGGELASLMTEQFLYCAISKKGKRFAV